MDYERIALWVLVIVMFIKLFVVREFYTASTPLGIMDLAEFNGVPGDIKQIWQDNIVNKIMPAIGAKMTEVWGTVSTADKLDITTKTGEAATQMVTNITNAPIAVEDTPPETVTI
jgi:hypothetical protein